jgi:glycine dehydrogenase
MTESLSDLEAADRFATRHIGVWPDDDQRHVLKEIGYRSLDELLDDAVPASIRSDRPLTLPPAASEAAAAAELRALADRNVVLTSMIGLGYYDTITPAVIRRNVLENPAWYTAYTPYQPEISQGRLEALLNFQTVVEDLTGLPVAGASMLDEATAAAEAMALAHRVSRTGNTFVVDADAFPQTIDVIRTRAVPLGLEVVVHDLSQPLPEAEIFGVLAQYPGASGAVRDLGPIVEATHERGAQLIVAADLLALTLLKTPGEVGADIAVGTTQRFGVPMGFGGPHAARASVARAARRRLRRRRRSTGVPARTADPRAAHPAREGDIQHLHGAGAARGDREHVCRLPRPERAHRDRAACPSPRLDPRHGIARRRCGRREGAVLRHDHGLGPAPRRRRGGGRPTGRHQPPPR